MFIGSNKFLLKREYWDVLLGNHRAKVPLGLPTKVHPVEITSKRQENGEDDEDHHRNFNVACSAL